MQWLTDAGLGYEQAEWILRMACAMLAGAVLGLDREVRRRRIGVRTYMMVSLGAAVFALIAMEMAADAEISGFAADPSRVLQGLIGGLGFLGAGAIIQGEKKRRRYGHRRQHLAVGRGRPGRRAGIFLYRPVVRGARRVHSGDQRTDVQPRRG